MPGLATAERYFSKSEDQKRLLDRLARVEGQLRGVQRMIREEADCERVVQQLAAARGGLHRAFCDLIACAFEAKLDLGPEAPHPVREKLSDLSELLKKYA
ncbi:MAG: metal-sensing transcriptional repressor [Acidobacteriota bacterium]|nr:metal-sensing transcriptional repressor [Acidobacteriota bacterium]